MSTMNLQSDSRSYLRYILLGFFALFLAACDPTAKFTFTPNPAVQGEPVKFDASASTAHKSEDGNTLTKYEWKFGDGKTGTGKTTEHTYTNAGEYAVELTVTDAEGKTNTIKQSLKVAASVKQTAAVSVEDAKGVKLAGAKVEIDGVSADTNNKGVAVVQLNSDNTEYVVKASLTGYVTQSVTVKKSELSSVRLVLLPVKKMIQIAAVEKAQAFSVARASVTIPANAFVDKNGNAAKGKATLQLTPWNFRNASDLPAFLGNGQAIDAQGNAAELISAGMMTVDFFDAQGNKLQLAQGKTADIKMPLYNKNINGQEMKAGTEIPLWSFDENKGKWVEEGKGRVDVVNFKKFVTATVSHFSTWNWDVKFEAGGSVNVKCVDQQNQATACNVKATVTLPDGSILLKSSAIPAKGAKIINMPPKAKVKWDAKTTNGLNGTASSGIEDVVIKLGAPTTAHFVRCALPDATLKTCKVNTIYTTATGTQMIRYNLPKTGGLIETGFKDVTKVVWDALSGFEIVSDKKLVYYTGKLETTSTQESVNITLDNKETITGEFELSCDRSNIPNTSKDCTVDLNGSYALDSVVDKNFIIPINKSIYVPYADLAGVEYGGFDAYVDEDQEVDEEGNYGDIYNGYFGFKKADLPFPNNKVSIKLYQGAIPR